MTLFRGFGDDLPLMEWLEQRIWPAESRLRARRRLLGHPARVPRDDPVRHRAVLGHVLAPARRRRAVLDSGIRATVGQPILEFEGAPDGARPEAAAEGIAELGRLGPRVRGALTPHAHYSVTEPSLRLIAEISDPQQVPVHTHLSETEQEVHDCIDGARLPPGAVPRPARAAQRAHGARARRLARRRGARAHRRARRDDRDEPGVEHEARGRARVPLPAGARGRGRGRARHRRRGLEQLARPARGHEDARVAPEAHLRRSVDDPGGRGLGDRDRRARTRARRDTGRGRCSRPTSCSSTATASR